MYTRRIINKIPGSIPAEDQKEKQGYIGDLRQKSLSQLNELLQRQLHLLGNKAFINKLPDKGCKIMKFKETILDELNKRKESDENLTKMLSALSMNGKEDVDALEWTGRCNPGHVTEDDGMNDSDIEEDPLKILACHSGAGFHKKKHKIVKPEEVLVKPSDLASGEEELDEYAKHLCEKLDAVKSTKAKFLPNRTLKKEKQQKRERQWEVTAATPPLPVHGDTKLVSLHESIKLQTEQQLKLKEVQMKHAVERLNAWNSKEINKLPPVVGAYRDPASSDSSDDEQSEHEVHDEEYPDGGGVTVYNLVDDTND